MKKMDIEDDGSFGYEFSRDDLRDLILEKHPELIDDKHKFDSIDIGYNNIALMIVKSCCGRLVYKNDTIKCGEWSGGDQHFCNKCFNDNEKCVKHAISEAEEKDE